MGEVGDAEMSEVGIPRGDEDGGGMLSSPAEGEGDMASRDEVDDGPTPATEDQ
jgi:hypothetical protein